MGEVAESVSNDSSGILESSEYLVPFEDFELDFNDIYTALTCSFSTEKTDIVRTLQEEVDAMQAIDNLVPRKDGSVFFSCLTRLWAVKKFQK